MATRDDLRKWVEEALKYNNGQATIVEVARFVWKNYEHDLEKSGDLFYTWQYDIRWAATGLRKCGIVKDSDQSPKGVWELT